MTVVFNRGKKRLAESGWNTGLDVRALVLAGTSVPAGAENPDLNTVAELLAVSGAVEASAAGYARVALTGETVLENDTTDTADLDAADLSWASIATGDTLRAVVFYVEGANDAARDLVSLNTLSSPVPTNGGGISLTVAANGLIGVG